MRLKLWLFLLCLPLPLFAKAHPLILQSKFETETLFIQQASAATLRKNPNDPGKLQLILRGVYQRTLYIAGGSKKTAGSITMHDFLKIWDENAIQFQDSGPTAIMGYLSFKPFTKGCAETDSLELINPIYESSSNSLIFTAVPQHSDSVKTGRFKNVVIVYDGLNISSKEMTRHYQVMPSPKLIEKETLYENN